MIPLRPRSYQPSVAPATRPTREEAGVRFTDLRHWGEPSLGGHFPALEQPETFAAELIAFFDLVR